MRFQSSVTVIYIWCAMQILGCRKTSQKSIAEISPPVQANKQFVSPKSATSVVGDSVSAKGVVEESRPTERERMDTEETDSEETVPVDAPVLEDKAASTEEEFDAEAIDMAIEGLIEYMYPESGEAGVADGNPDGVGEDSSAAELLDSDVAIQQWIIEYYASNKKLSQGTHDESMRESVQPAVVDDQVTVDFAKDGDWMMVDIPTPIDTGIISRDAPTKDVQFDRPPSELSTFHSEKESVDESKDVNKVSGEMPNSVHPQPPRLPVLSLELVARLKGIFRRAKSRSGAKKLAQAVSAAIRYDETWETGSDDGTEPPVVHQQAHITPKQLMDRADQLLKTMRTGEAVTNKYVPPERRTVAKPKAIADLYAKRVVPPKQTNVAAVPAPVNVPVTTDDLGTAYSENRLAKPFTLVDSSDKTKAPIIHTAQMLLVARSLLPNVISIPGLILQDAKIEKDRKIGATAIAHLFKAVYNAHNRKIDVANLFGSILQKTKEDTVSVQSLVNYINWSVTKNEYGSSYPIQLHRSSIAQFKTRLIHSNDSDDEESSENESPAVVIFHKKPNSLASRETTLPPSTLTIDNMNFTLAGVILQKVEAPGAVSSYFKTGARSYLIDSQGNVVEDLSGEKIEKRFQPVVDGGNFEYILMYVSNK